MDAEDSSCQVMNTSASGNVFFEVLMSPKASDSPRRAPPLHASPKGMSLSSIQEKLVAADRRRESFESQKVEKARIEGKLAEAAARRKDLEEQFRLSSRDDLHSKLETNKENRQKVIEERLDKIKEHEKRLEEARERSEQKGAELEAEIARKLTRAEELRNQKLEDLLAKLKQQDEHMEKVRAQRAERAAVAGDLEALEQQLRDVEHRRQAIIDAIKEKQRAHEPKVDEVHCHQPELKQQNN